jgi:hypothetical protein
LVYTVETDRMNKTAVGNSSSIIPIKPFPNNSPTSFLYNTANVEAGKYK